MQAKQYTGEDAKRLMKDLATMDAPLAYAIAISIPDSLRRTIVNSDQKSTFENIIAQPYSNYFSPPKSINLNLDIIDLNYLEPFSINETRKPYGETEVVFLKDAKNDEFVLKFYPSIKSEESIPEYLGSYIGLSVGIPINKVKIIPPHTIVADKVRISDNVTTLHTLAPGIMVREEPKLAHVNIQLGLKSPQNLNSISLHPDLCDIVSLDILLNNKDRGQSNYFFDAENNRYHAIDMGGIFSGIRDNNRALSAEKEIQRFFPKYIFEKTVSFMAYIFLKTLDVNKLSQKEIDALKRVNSTVKKLFYKFPSEILYHFWIQKGQEFGFRYSENKKSTLKLYIDYNAHYVKKVIEELDRLTQ